MMILERVKYLLTKIGSRLSAETINVLDAAIDYLEVGSWMRKRGFAKAPRFSSRFDIFELVGQSVSEKGVLYLEFGVSRGESMERWSRILRSPEARLHGFDSFEGLPEDWTWRDRKGAFSTGQQLPDIKDQRVRFFPGLFQDTLPNYRPPPHEVLIISMDADLYSSTIFVLRQLRDLIQSGTYLYFDEFSDRNHELRAFDEFLLENEMMQFELVATSKSMLNAMFRRRF